MYDFKFENICNVFNQNIASLSKTLNDISEKIQSLKFEKNSSYIIDRIENDIAVCENVENNNMVQISLKDIYGKFREGSYIVKRDNKFVVDDEKTNQMLDKIENKYSSLFK